MDLAMQSVFERANVVVGESFYALETFSEDGEEMRSSLGLTVAHRRNLHRRSRARGSRLAGEAARRDALGESLDLIKSAAFPEIHSKVSTYGAS
ncbi:transcriptional regulator GlxA family with amidase domain [Paraburkholderia atlantica]